jgi:tripartite ATP-independent transporter DctM subunit
LGVLLASIANVDVGQLLIAGVVPGFLLAGLYTCLIVLQLKINPEGAPTYEVEPIAWKEKIYQIVVNILPMGLVVFMVIGFIVLGWATPSESASFGVMGVVLLAVIFRRFTWKAFGTALMGTLRTAGMVFFILMNSTVFSQLLAISGASQGLVNWATGFDVAPIIILGAMFLVLLMLGMFMDQVSMMLITVPIFYPLIAVIGTDIVGLPVEQVLVWFSLIVLISLEMAGTTPPFGLLLFIMLGMVRGTTLGEVALAAAPYLLCDLILVLLLIAFPLLAMYLPNLMGI